tara:strand:+ start:661 stop:783 length:123 start_codon:yes stop_codon:yes gene_type:complete
MVPSVGPVLVLNGLMECEPVAKLKIRLENEIWVFEEYEVA